MPIVHRRAYAGAPSNDTGATEDWRDRAACLDVNPELFFPDGESEAYREQIAVAKSVCESCPVLAECEAHVLAAEGRAAGSMRHGIWAGMLPRERANKARAKTRKPRPRVDS